MAFFKAMGRALGAPLRAPGMGAVTKPMNKMMGATPGMRGIPAALGMGQQKPQPGVGPSQGGLGGMIQKMKQPQPQMQPPPQPMQQQQPPPEAMDQQKMLADYQQQGQAAGQDMGWMQRPGAIAMGPQQNPQEQQRSKLAQMFQQMRQRPPMQDGGQMARPQVMPGRRFGIGPQLNMMPQFAQQAPQQMQQAPQEEQY